MDFDVAPFVSPAIRGPTVLPLPISALGHGRRFATTIIAALHGQFTSDWYGIVRFGLEAEARMFCGVIPETRCRRLQDFRERGEESMAVPTNKDELLSAIESNFEKLFEDLREVPLSAVDDTSLDGHAKGTRMSVSNLVAYLIGWNELVLKWLERDATGLPIEFPETGFRWNELGRLARKFYRDYEDIPYPQLTERLAHAKTRIVSLIEERSNDELYGRPWYEKWTMGRMIQFNTASPYANARRRLRIWLKAESRPRRP